MPGEGFHSACKEHNKAHPLLCVEVAYFQVVNMGLNYFFLAELKSYLVVTL